MEDLKNGMMENGKMSDTTNYEPPPTWGCNHSWMNVNPAYRIFASDNSNQTCLDNIPYMQKQQCIICGGYRTIEVGIDE
jgi:hypothetical protein